MEYRFAVPKGTRDLFSKKPFKTVKTEHWRTNGITLVGDVGGTLGLFVGFSFLATSEWLMTVIAWVWKLKRHLIQDTKPKEIPKILCNINIVEKETILTMYK